MNALVTAINNTVNDVAWDKIIMGCGHEECN